jgi:hypothetical protein
MFVHSWPKIFRTSLGSGLPRGHSALLTPNCCSTSVSLVMSLFILFGSARARKIENELQQNARRLDVAMWREDAQSETLLRKFVITIVGIVPNIERMLSCTVMDNVWRELNGCWLVLLWATCDENWTDVVLYCYGQRVTRIERMLSCTVMGNVWWELNGCCLVLLWTTCGENCTDAVLYCYGQRVTRIERMLACTVMGNVWWELYGCWLVLLWATCDENWTDAVLYCYGQRVTRIERMLACNVMGNVWWELNGCWLVLLWATCDENCPVRIVMLQ